MNDTFSSIISLYIIWPGWLNIITQSYLGVMRVFSFVRRGCSQGPETGNYMEWPGVPPEQGQRAWAREGRILQALWTFWLPGLGVRGGAAIQEKRPRDGGDVVCGSQALPRVEHMLRLKRKENDKRPSLDDGSLTSRTTLTRTLQRSCATPSSITGSLAGGHQGTLLRSTMRTFPARSGGPESRWEEPRLSTHFSMCLPPLGIHLPRKVNMSFSVSSRISSHALQKPRPHTHPSEAEFSHP